MCTVHETRHDFKLFVELISLFLSARLSLQSLAKSDVLESDSAEWIAYKNTSVKADLATQAAVRYSAIIDAVTAAIGVASNARMVGIRTGFCSHCSKCE